MKVIFSDNQLLVNKHHITFPFPIREVMEFNDSVIVLLSIPFNKNIIDNLYSVSCDGKINWQSQSLNSLYPNENLMPYEQMVIINQIIIASDFYGRNYSINPVNGKIINRTIGR